MATALLALGLVLVVEGLVYVLAPSLVDSLLAALRSMTPEQLRLAGLTAMALGLLLIWCVHALGVRLGTV